LKGADLGVSDRYNEYQDFYGEDINVEDGDDENGFQYEPVEE
jgi:hypothetical protein